MRRFMAPPKFAPADRDARAEFPRLQTIRKEIATPTDASNKQTTSKTIELIQVCCAQIVEELRDRTKRTWRYLKIAGGDYQWGSELSKQAHADTKGCYATNDILAESVFGAIDQYLHSFRTIGIAAASTQKRPPRPRRAFRGKKRALLVP